jgi:hypothetical protein
MKTHENTKNHLESSIAGRIATEITEQEDRATEASFSVVAVTSVADCERIVMESDRVVSVG